MWGRGAKESSQTHLGFLPVPHTDFIFSSFAEEHGFVGIVIALVLYFLMIMQVVQNAQTAPDRAGLYICMGAAAILLFALPLSLHGSAASAYRDYQKGKYGDALKEYERLLERKKDDPRLHFNAGAAAYRGRQYEEAAKQFDHALNSPDLKLLQQAYYNRANSRFFIGEVEADSQKKQKTWEDSLQDFESALKLNTQDADAKFNRDFVKKKLEELKQQQQQKNDQQKPPEPSEAAKKAKAEADAAVTRHEYAKALKIMETQLKQDPTTAYYSDYIKRLKEVNGVQEPPKQ